MKNNDNINNRPDYRTEIDGLRALAVLPVLFFHAGFDLFGGGFIGVDIFFVISGYLITTILITELEAGKFHPLKFYERRCRRILPALMMVVFLCFFASWIMMKPNELKGFGEALIGVATFTSNFIFARSRGYFDESTEINPLLHTWSLSVEEQFYILFPILLAIGWQFGRQKIFWLISTLAILSLILCELGTRQNIQYNFFFSPSRAWELFAGSIVAVVIWKSGPKKNDWLSAAGLCGIILPIFFYDQNTPFPSLFALPPVAGTALIILYANQGSFTAKLLGTKFLALIGLISYSAYLLHQPLFAYTRLFLNRIELGTNLAIFLITLSLALAYLSWRFVEQPFRNNCKFKRKSIFCLSAAALAICLSMGLVSRNASVNIASVAANQLASSDFIYATYSDERIFNEARLSLPLKKPEIIVMGSSRMMNISSKMLDKPSLNFSVSGASIEDHFAFIGESVHRLRPKKVIIGLDPWLFNKFASQPGWKSSQRLAMYWRKQIINQTLSNFHSEEHYSENSRIRTQSVFQRVYSAINLQDNIVAKNGKTEPLAKVAYDGSRIPSIESHGRSQDEIRKNFHVLIDYSMREYEQDITSKNNFIDLIRWLKSMNVDVTLVLSPYHPELFNKMRIEKPVFLDIENEFRRIANNESIKIVGSYDPRRAGCKLQEFFDGMHPTKSCMEKIVRK